MLQCSKRVTCRIDRQQRVFYFVAIQNPDGTYRPGLRHGCNAKTGDHRCALCWRDVKRDVFKSK